MKTSKSYQVILPKLHPGQMRLFEALNTHRFVVACVPPNTFLVGTNKPICDIEIGDEIVSRCGRKTKVKEVFKRFYSGTLYTIKARFLLPIRCTEEHPLLVTRVTNDGNTSDTVWMAAKEVSGAFKKDRQYRLFLNVPILQGSYKTTEWRLFNGNLPLTVNTSWVLGVFAASQHTLKHLKLKHEGIAKKIQNILSENGFTVSVYRERDQYVVRVSTDVSSLFGELLGTKNRRIPDEILFHKDISILRAFIEGYLVGTGYSCQTKTHSESFAQQLQLAFIRLGKMINISSKPARRFWRHKQFLIDITPKQEYKRRPGFFLVPIEEVCEEDYQDYVYNLSCEDETYLVSNAVTHNCTGRRWGKTLGALIIMFYKALEQPNYIAWWVAPSYKISKRSYRLFKTICDRSLISYISDTDMYIKLINGSVIEFKSSDRPEGLLGEGLNFVVYDEIAEGSPESWYMYLLPCLSDKRGQALLLSRPYGNWFYDLCEEIQASDEGTVMYFESRENPYFPPEEWEAAKKRLPPAIFQAEYAAQWVKGASAVFPNAKDVLVKTLPRYYTPTIIGVDPGRTRDFFFIAIVNTRRQIVYLMHYRGMPFNEQIEVIRKLSKTYDGHVYIDSHVLGYGLYDMLKASDVGMRVTAWPIKDPKARALAIETLALELDPSRPEHFSLPTDFPQECEPSLDELIKELSSMDYKFMPNGLIKYEAGQGIHDDGVIALGLAAIGLNDRYSRVVQIRPTPVKRYNKPDVTRKFSVQRKYSKKVASHDKAYL